MESSMNKMRDMFDLRGRAGTYSDECANQIAEEILTTKGLSDEEQTELIRQLEVQTIQMMDEMYDGEESPND
jgi:hypothetical protein